MMQNKHSQLTKHTFKENYYSQKLCHMGFVDTLFETKVFFGDQLLGN
jgi:hypothetical protein